MHRSNGIDDVLQDAVEKGVVPGLVGAATTAGGPIYQRGLGRRGLATDAPMTEDTVFWIASMTKGLTSVAAMRLVERGALRLDAPIGEMVPELASPQVLEGFDAAGAPRLRPASRPLTLRHLLTHTSGFAEDVWHPDIASYMRYAGLPPGGTRKLVTLRLPLLFEPGTAWQYGISHEWVGLAIERASGERLDEHMRRHVFGPLGMVDSCWDLADHQQPRLAGVQRREASGALTPFVRELPKEREYIPGGGSLHSTAADYLAFIRMMLNGGAGDGGHRILTEETVARMAQNSTGDIEVGRLAPTMPGMSNPVAFMAGMPRCWGLGFQVNLAPLPTGRSGGSLAWAGLGNTYFWIDPAAGVGGVLMTQLLPFADPAVLDLFARFETAVYAAVT
jgi:CubicO group peptidase (beta-lactamase class C family)